MSTKTNRFRDMGVYSGAGAGIALFCLYGFLPSSFIGGILALNMLGSEAGMMGGQGILGRVVVAIFMVFSVVLTGFISGFAGATCGRLLGSALDRVHISRGRASREGSGERVSSTVSEKRQVPRAIVSTVVKVEAAGRGCTADMNDLSEKGACLSFVNASCNPIHSGQRLICTLPGNVVKESRVVWKEDSDSACLVGIEFIEPEDEHKPVPKGLSM